MIKLKFRRAPSVDWDNTNLILEAGEPGYATDTGVFKVGDGFSRWGDLSSYYTYEEMVASVAALVQQGIEDANIVDENDVVTMIDDHINDETPHPVYDEGVSLYLLYQNAKA